MMPPRIAQMRRDFCADAKCDAAPAFHDPCARCPNGHWGAHVRQGCEDPYREIPQPLNFQERRQKIAIEPKPWPLALIPLKLLAKDGDRGAGDIIARAIGPIGGDTFKAWYQRIFGKSCGCGARVETLNARYPL